MSRKMSRACGSASNAPATLVSRLGTALVRVEDRRKTASGKVPKTASGVREQQICAIPLDFSTGVRATDYSLPLGTFARGPELRFDHLNDFLRSV